MATVCTQTIELNKEPFGFQSKSIAHNLKSFFGPLVFHAGVDLFWKLRAAIMKVNLSNEQCFQRVHCYAVSWIIENQATGTQRTVELFNWF